jgi:hypothetical protein
VSVVHVAPAAGWLVKMARGFGCLVLADYFDRALGTGTESNDCICGEEFERENNYGRV